MWRFIRLLVYAVLYTIVVGAAVVCGLFLPFPQHASLALGCFVLGAAIGSGWCQYTYRRKAGMKIDSPPSHCPHCKTNIKPWHNVPIVGWLLLRGRCASCNVSIPIRYPLQELAFALVFACMGAGISTVVGSGVVIRFW